VRSPKKIFTIFAPIFWAKNSVLLKKKKSSSSPSAPKNVHFSPHFSDKKSLENY